MPIRSFTNIPRDLVEWGRFFKSTEIIPDPESVGNGSIQDGAVTYRKFQDVEPNRLLGRDTSPAGQLQEIVVSGGIEFTGASSIQRSELTGDITAAAGSTTTTLAANVVDDSKFRASVATSVVGRSADSTGNVADIAAGSDGHYLRRAAGALSFGAIDDADIPASIARDAEVAAAVAALNLSSGTYTPALTSVANLDSTTGYSCQYMRVGSVVTVSGRLDANPTATATTTIGISLPIASNLANANECAGTAFSSEVAGQGAAIFGDSANDRALMQWVAVDITDHPMFFTFTYRII